MRDLDLAKIFDSMKQNGISELIIKEGSKIYEVRRGGFKQSVALDGQQAAQGLATVSQPILQGTETHIASQVSKSEKTMADSSKEKDETKVEKSDLYELKSPLVGTYYASPKPDAPPFVEVGDKVKKGQKLCIVEAMKTFNEIESEVDGIIEEICAKNEELVEFGKVLFKIKLS